MNAILKYIELKIFGGGALILGTQTILPVSKTL